VISSLSRPVAVSVREIGPQVCPWGDAGNHLGPFTAQVTATLAVPFTTNNLRRFVASAEEFPLGRGGVLSTEEEMLGALHDVHLSEHRLDDWPCGGRRGTPGLGAELSCSCALWVSRSLRIRPFGATGGVSPWRRRPVADQGSMERAVAARRLSPEK